MQATRRVFLVTLPAVAVGGVRAAANQTGLDAFGGASLPCAADVLATPAVPRDAHYRPGAPLRHSLLEPGVAGTRLTVSGVVAGLTCGPIGGATLEFWQADARGSLDARSFRLRGRQLTESSGRYRLETVMPGPMAGQAPYIGVHVAVEGKAQLWTAMFFHGHPGNARDARVKDALLVRPTGTRDALAATFDIRLDL